MYGKPERTKISYDYIKEFTKEYVGVLKALEMADSTYRAFSLTTSIERGFQQAISDKYGYDTADKYNVSFSYEKLPGKEWVYYVKFQNKRYASKGFKILTNGILRYGNETVDQKFLKSMDKKSYDEVSEYLKIAVTCGELIIDKVNEWIEESKWIIRQREAKENGTKLLDNMRLNGKGYIDDPEKIESAVNSFLDMPMSELLSVMDPVDANNFTSVTGYYYDYAVEALHTLSVADTICLMKSMKDTDIGERASFNIWDIQQYKRDYFKKVTDIIMFNKELNSKVITLFFIKFDSLLEFCKQKRPDFDLENYLSKITKCEEDFIRTAAWKQDWIKTDGVTIGSILNEIFTIIERRLLSDDISWCHDEREVNTCLCLYRLFDLVFYELLYENFKEKMDYEKLNARLMVFNKPKYKPCDLNDILVKITKDNNQPGTINP